MATEDSCGVACMTCDGDWHSYRGVSLAASTTFLQMLGRHHRAGKLNHERSSLARSSHHVGARSNNGQTSSCLVARSCATPVGGNDASQPSQLTGTAQRSSLLARSCAHPVGGISGSHTSSCLLANALFCLLHCCWRTNSACSS